MIELPETYVLASQINETLVGKTIKHAIANASPHSFAWYTGDPALYGPKLEGQAITSSNPGTGYTCGGNTEIICDDFVLVISTPIKYHNPGTKIPKTHQLLLQFDDDSHMSCTVQMWGSMLCAPASEIKNSGHFANSHLPDPLTNAFDENYFEALWKNAKPSLSAKALLATEQRIPGLGNGVCQDILFNARIHPKRKLEAMGDTHMEALFNSVKTTLMAMKDGGGRDTERDLYSNYGGYRTILSKKTIGSPCIECGGVLIRQSFLGGNIYFCELCQPMEG
ncbi:MAG: endonuclease VIII [Defluviitaleaceae bacterium]|nr:endonuclease VIII [Defluviitaleaceae bacterium]